MFKLAAMNEAKMNWSSLSVSVRSRKEKCESTRHANGCPNSSRLFED